MERRVAPAVVGGSSWLPLSGLEGELDVTSIPALRALLRDAASQSPAGVLVDLSCVTFMDCSALGVLLEARAHLGGRLMVKGVEGRVRRLLNATGVYRDLVAVEPPGTSWPRS